MQALGTFIPVICRTTNTSIIGSRHSKSLFLNSPAWWMVSDRNVPEFSNAMSALLVASIMSVAKLPAKTWRIFTDCGSLVHIQKMGPLNCMILFSFDFNGLKNPTFPWNVRLHTRLAHSIVISVLSIFVCNLRTLIKKRKRSKNIYCKRVLQFLSSKGLPSCFHICTRTCQMALHI